LGEREDSGERDGRVKRERETVERETMERETGE
jgi:hypothetical protein